MKIVTINNLKSFASKIKKKNDAFSFELGKVKSKSVQQQVVDMYANVSLELAIAFAEAIGANPPKEVGSSVTKSSPALSQEGTKKVPDTRKLGVIVGDGLTARI